MYIKRPPRNQERNVVIVARYKECGNLRTVAAEFGITHQGVSYILKKMGCPARGQTIINDPRLPEIVERCKTLRSVPKAAAEYGISGWTLAWVLREKNIRIKAATAEGRFWERVDMSEPKGCWMWNGTKHAKGYGQVSYHRRSWYAHRLAWYLTHGSVPELPLELLHSCGVPLCCNPSHMRIGTRDENAADRVRHKVLGKGPQVVQHFV